MPHSAWAGVVTTAAAFTVTLIVLFREIRQRRGEKADQERQQARLVWASTVDQRETESGQHPGWRSVSLRPAIHNESDRPIHNVVVDVQSANGFPMGTTRQPESIGPRNTGELYLRRDLPKEQSLGEGGFTLTFWFTDGEGRRWKNNTVTKLLSACWNRRSGA